MNNKTNINKNNDSTEIPIDWNYIKSFFLDIIDLKKGVDKLGTIEEIKAKKSMAGANAWMLMCSIIIASIGLDRNSDAVIIGAMLISPLMSPILGIGLGIGINDKDVVKQSVVHFSVAIIIALLTSFIYFSFSPFGQITNAIAARTEPLVLDVLVAIFGGLAGIISIARKDISTTLPGVAIATALMPPLCVTGFGLATHNWSFALNSFYLFILNTSFISLSTYLIVRYLKFPYRRYVNPKERFRNRMVMIIFSLLIIIPSFFILQNVLEKVNTQTKINAFIENTFGKDNVFLDGYKTNILPDSISTLVLKVYGEEINQSKVPEYLSKMREYNLDNWDISILQSSEVDLDQIYNLQSKIEDIELLNKREKERRLAEKKLQQSSVDSTKLNTITAEFKTLYNTVEEISFAEMFVAGPTKNKIPTFIIQMKDATLLQEDEKTNIQNYLKLRCNLDSIRVYFQ